MTKINYIKNEIHEATYRLDYDNSLSSFKTFSLYYLNSNIIYSKSIIFTKYYIILKKSDLENNKLVSISIRPKEKIFLYPNYYPETVRVDDNSYNEICKAFKKYQKAITDFSNGIPFEHLNIEDVIYG